jgi:predicted N-formylglutamate amidohydrolase
MTAPPSVAGVADVELLGDGARVELVVEVPHGADRRAHYDALRARLAGPLPVGLEEFFFVNTDVGAWQVGRRVAERLVTGGKARGALVVRCLVPRTFIDCNRIEEATEADGMTASVPAYVTAAADRALLHDHHRRYVAVVEAALAEAGERAFLLMPHTYGPVTLGIERVDETIVEKLRWAHEPARHAEWPVRPEVDLITRLADGESLAAPGVMVAVAAAYRSMGIEVAENRTYHMHPATLGHRWSRRFAGRTLSLEIRRDLLVRDFQWNRENDPDPVKVDRFAGPLASAIAAYLGS